MKLEKNKNKLFYIFLYISDCFKADKNTTGTGNWTKTFKDNKTDKRFSDQLRGNQQVVTWMFHSAYSICTF